MAMISCRECGESVSEWAKKCPRCGIKRPSKTDNIVYMALVAFVGVSALWFIGSGRLAEMVGASQSANANCRLTDVKVDHEVFVINDQPDYGFNVRMNVQNDRDSTVKVSVRLLTSEGDWTRTREVALRKDAPRMISVGFHEPTIASQDIRWEASCR